MNHRLLQKFVIVCYRIVSGVINKDSLSEYTPFKRKVKKNQKSPLHSFNQVSVNLLDGALN